MTTLTKPICESVRLTGHYVKEYMLAGNAIFTLRSIKTGTRFTYRVRAANDTTLTPYFVHLLTGPDNTHDYQFLGTLFADGEYKHSHKSRIAADAPSAKGAKWFIQRTAAGLPCCNVEFFHEGRCGRCGRRLTVPESIMSGIGPECSKKD